MDLAHDSWVLGGTFKQIYKIDPERFEPPNFITKVKSRYFFKTLYSVLASEVFKRRIIFSSLTPFENYLKIAKLSWTKKALLFTHYDGIMPDKIIKLFNKSNLIFVYSHNDIKKLSDQGVKSKIIPITGAIDPDLFTQIKFEGQKIAWIGTPVSRKNPEYLLSFAQKSPQITFKVFGRNWRNSPLWTQTSGMKNIEYHEIIKPVNSTDLFDCSHFLMLSRLEGGPMTLLEALASGLIPICTKTGIVEEILNETGYLNQIVAEPLNLSELSIKINAKYSHEHRKHAAEIALKYSFKRLTRIISSEIGKL